MTDENELRHARIESGHAIIRRYSYWAAGLGLIPLPVVDFVAITGVQVKMLLDIAKQYPVAATEEHVRGAIAALLGGGAPVLVGGSIISAFKFVPGIGQIAGVLTVPALAAASTIAIGRVFLQHFETGGTLLDCDVEKMREFFRKEFEAAKADPKGAANAPLPENGEATGAGGAA
jgi:uncharacterized protein (DUF697 family)